MGIGTKLETLFDTGDKDFKPYYQKENSFKRMVIIHSIAAFIINPIFCLLISDSIIPKVYLYLGISYSVCFSVYIPLCYFVKYFNDKLIYFFFLQVFGMTYFAFIDLVSADFNILDIYAFSGLYAVSVFVLQRFYPTLFYFCFISVLIGIGYSISNTPDIGFMPFYGFLSVLGLSAVVVLYSREKMIHSVEDYSNYLMELINKPGIGYMLVEIEKSNCEIIDNNDCCLELLHLKEQEAEKVRDFIFTPEIIRQITTEKETTIQQSVSKNDQTFEVKINRLELKNGTYWLASLNDITLQLKGKKEFQNMLNNIPEGIIIVRNKKVVFTNPEVENLLGGGLDCISAIFSKKDQEKFDKLFEKQQLSGEKIEQQFQINSKKEKVYAEVTIVSTTFQEEKATMIILKNNSLQHKLSREVLRAELAEENNRKLEKEIREKIVAENKLENLLLRTQAIYESSTNTLLMTVNMNDEITYFNSHCHNFFKQITNKSIKRNSNLLEFLSDIIPKNDRRFFRSILRDVKQGKAKQVETRIGHKQKEYWINLFINPVLDAKNKVAEFSLVAHDITEKKNNELEIVNSLKEKEILLKEIHHRVKNNLQVISSILNLQSSFVKDEQTIDVLTESRNRIRAMSMIHENLYSTTNFSSIDFSEYIYNLIINLISLYGIDQNTVKLTQDLNDVRLGLDQAVPCGLLINELVTNAAKYAFPNNRKGEITINLSEEKGKIYIQIKDNGVGLPKEFKIQESETLGLQLVLTLVEQLEGEVKLNTLEGTEFLVNFEKAKG